MNQTAATNETLKNLYSRHSVRNYKVNHPMPEADLKEILKAAGAAPSAWNLQHWKFLMIESQADKEKLLPIAYNQKQVVDSSVTIAVLGDTEANKNADVVYGKAVRDGYMPADVGERLIASIDQAYGNPGSTIGRDQAFLNASLAGMQLMIAAQALGYNTVPMSGFDAGRLSEVFSIPERYVPVMLISVGLGEDSGRGSGRFPVEDTIFHS